VIKNNSTPRQILVGVVSHTGTTDIWFCQALVESVKLCLSHNIILIPVLVRSQGNATMNYNLLLTIAWREKMDGLLLLSPEVNWDPSALLEVVQSSKDVLVLPVFGQQGFQVQLGEIPRLQTDEVTGEIKVLGAGLGFFRLSKKVLETLCETHSSIDFEGQDVKLILQHGDIYGGFAFDAEILTHRLNEAGYEIWMNPKHSVNTMTTQLMGGDFAAALKEEQGG